MWCEYNFPSYVLNAYRNKNSDIRAHTYQSWVFARDREIRYKALGKSEEQLSAEAEAERLLATDKGAYKMLFGVIGLALALIILIAYGCWMFVWYTIEGRVDPLSLFLYYSYRLARERIWDMKITLSPLFWYRFWSSLFDQAGSLTMEDMRVYHGH